MNRNNNYTFEQLCIRKESGYSCDIGTLFIPSNPGSFDDVVFKIISKIDTSLLLLKTHGEDVSNFTIIAVPLSSHQSFEDENTKVPRSYQGRKQARGQASENLTLDISALQNAWDYLSGEGWHGLQSLSLLQPDSIPVNGSRKYSLYQYTTCIMDVVRANYMFQKFRDNFHHETLEMFDEADINKSTQALFGLLWKRAPSLLSARRVTNIQSPLKRRAGNDASLNEQSPQKQFQRPFNRPTLSANSRKKNFMEYSAPPGEISESGESEEEDEYEEVDEKLTMRNPPQDSIERKATNIQSPFKRRTGNDVSLNELSQKKLQRSINRPTLSMNSRNKNFMEYSAPPAEMSESEEGEDEEVDDEITFRKPPQAASVRYHTVVPMEVDEEAPVPMKSRRSQMKVPSPPSVPNYNDVTLAAPGRSRRKPQINEPSSTPIPNNDDDTSAAPVKSRRKPPMNEQSPPSVPNYDDVTLGFEISANTSTTAASSTAASRKSMARKSMSSADWPEEERMHILSIFDNLNPSVSEQKRIALTCKYVALQLNKDLPSKLLYQWIQKKGREIKRTIKSYELSQGNEQKEVALEFYKKLDEESSSEASRVSFTLKYLEVQYSLNVTSKQLYTWLLEKPLKKTQKKR